MPPISLFDLNVFCEAIGWDAEIDGDSMLAVLFDKATGWFMGVITIC